MVNRLLTPLALTALVLSSCTRDATITPELEAKWSETGVYNLEVQTLEGTPVSLSDYAGKVSLVVNVASKCGLTPQYEGLQALHDELSPMGFTVLAFPCNQFLKQESGSAEEILAGARGRGFDGAGMHLMKKVKVNGPAADEVFLFLKAEAPCQIKWNFGAYFVVDGGGTVESFAGVHPRDLTARLDALLSKVPAVSGGGAQQTPGLDNDAVRALGRVAARELAAITGQKPIVTRAKKANAAFKLREGMPIGCKVTLRRERMYEFLDRLVNIALPRVRDFRGLNGKSFDGRGNYSMGIKEQIVFPEVDYDQVDETRGMDIIVVTSANTDDEARALLAGFEFPFIKS